MMIANELTVNTPSHQYPIFFSKDLKQLLLDKIESYLTSQVVIITNTTVQPLYLAMVEAVLKTKGFSFLSIILPDGEKYKNHDTLNSIYNTLLENNIERSTTLIALGGGVIGDIVGFAAATYQRGVPLIQIPTTLLSQVDSSVGGKTAINHPLGKNMIGAFYQPKAVMIGQNVLTTLPKREFAAGMAEVIKYALLGDNCFFAWLEDNIDSINRLDPESLHYIQYKCCKMKAEIVSQDEKERGIRALLNLGHTFGHVIEVELGYGKWLHGEAVAAGLVLAGELSMHHAGLSKNDLIRVKKLLQTANLPTVPPYIQLDHWMKAFLHDKKVQNGKMRFITLERIGKAVINSSVSEEDLERILTQYGNTHSKENQL